MHTACTFGPVDHGNDRLLVARHVVHTNEQGRPFDRIEFALGGAERLVILIIAPAGNIAPLPLILLRGGFPREELSHKALGVLASLTARRAQKTENVNSRIMALQREVTDTEERLKRLYRLVEDGVTDLDNVLKDRLNDLKADHDRAKAALEAAKAQIAPTIRIDPALIERFG